MIAVMIAAVMCAVPLFIIEDSDAAVTVTTGEKAVSFKASSITDEKFNGLVTQEYKDGLSNEVFNAIFPSAGSWALVDHATIKNVKNVKLALGNSVSEDGFTKVVASAIEFDVVMTAKCTNMLGTELYELRDGTQVLYKELGTNTIAYNGQVTIEGPVTIESYDYQEYSVVKNSSKVKFIPFKASTNKPP